MLNRGTIPITTKRLLLRRLRLRDVFAMNVNWAASENVTKYLKRDTQNMYETFKYIKNRKKKYKNKQFFEWGIVFENELVGVIGASKLFNITKYIHAEAEENVYEIGYCIGEKWWGKGIATEALGAVIDFMFSEGVDKLEVRHHIDNFASQKVIEKFPFVYQGLEEEHKTNTENKFTVKTYILEKEDYYGN